MSDAEKKLLKDLSILEKMAEDMGGYLRASALFGRMGGPNLPALTLGGYLMRQHRLLALQDVLAPADQERLKRAVFQFNTLMGSEIVRSEKRAIQEYAARLRQWEAYVRDLRTDPRQHMNYYSNSVEPRAMIEALLNLLSAPPYQFNPEFKDRLETLDGALQAMWNPGDFVWPEGWEPAYPIKSYWWLYGRVKTGYR